MANGRVLTGFSRPYVATYSASGTTITYTGVTPLARGVSVSIAPEVADDNIFYADNVAAETVGGTFTGGTVTLTVDGLKDAAEKLIYGTPTAGADGFIDYGDSLSIPYCGVGFIARYMEAGVTSWVPYVLTKVKFDVHGTEAATQEENIEWQTQELTARIMRDDGGNHNWKRVGEAETSEADAELALKTALGYTAPGP